jgi:hypothetical protein
MNTKNAIMTTTLSVIAVLAITSVTTLDMAFAEDNTEYKMADDIHAILTFTFKDGVETQEFPIFNMDDNFVANAGSPGFSVQGVVGNTPYLHKALDEAFVHKQNPSYEWNYQLFEVDVDYVKNGETVKTLSYHHCYVKDYKVETLTASYESYLSSSSGFAIIDDIDFQCAGVNPIGDVANITWQTGFATTDYGQSPYKFAEDVHTSITFEFDQGIEKVEFPFFEVTSGFEEKADNVIPGFSVEGTISKHPLLDQAIDNARKVSEYASGSNIDFDATVKLTRGDDVLRTLKYKDCRVTGAEMKTQYDKEEGFTGKSGFAHVEDLDFECVGLTTVNNAYAKLMSQKPVWDITKVEHTVPEHEYPLGTGPRAIATFKYDNGVEVIDFPIFDQGETLVKSNPTFELEGVVGDFPMLYKHVDDNLALTSITGASNAIDLFNVDVKLVDGDKVIRGFDYVDCRVTDYTVQSQRDKEESYFKGFVASNTFSFECKGYHPNNPVYDAMFVQEKAQTVSTNDLRKTQEWGPGFHVQ